MYKVNIIQIKNHIASSGIKQKLIAERAGIGEIKLSMILNGKRNLGAAEYIALCDVLNVEAHKFITKN